MPFKKSSDFETTIGKRIFYFKYEHFFFIQKTAIGEDLMTLVCRDLELVEKQFFSLTYRDFNNMKVN